MKSFEEFKEWRKSIDKSAAEFSEKQWENAYEAYKRMHRKRRGASRRSSRSETPGGEEGEAAVEARRETASETEAASGESAEASEPAAEAAPRFSRLGGILAHVQRESAYQGLRSLLAALAGVLIVLSVLGATIYLLFVGRFAGWWAAATFLAQALVGVLAVVALYRVVLLLVDMADVQLYRAHHEREARVRAAAEEARRQKQPGAAESDGGASAPEEGR